MDFETLPENLEDTTIEEVVESTEIIDSTTDFNDDEQSIIASEYAEYFLDEDGIEIETIYAAMQLRAANDVGFSDSDFIFTIDTGSREYRVLFPESARDYLVVRDGILINLNSSNITGLILSSDDSAAINTYHSQYMTIVSFTSTSGNNAAYQYGSYAYITTYSQGNYGSLTSTQNYIRPSVTKKSAIFSGFTQFELIVMLCLGLTVLISFFGGIFRK